VAVLVVDAGTDERDRRVGGRQELGGRRGVRAVVADLEHVDRADLAARDERRLDRHLRIPSEQCAEPTVPKLDHHRAVVDVAVGQGSGRVGG
jgi:hypothetical protein